MYLKWPCLVSFLEEGSATSCVNNPTLGALGHSCCDIQFARPSYQDEVVPAYLAALPNGTFEGLFNPNGRAIPDVSAQGDVSVELAQFCVAVCSSVASSSPL